jgi:large subunit ribosomal protein L18
MSGTVDRPRLIIHRTLKNFSGQVIDDSQNKTLFSLATSDKAIKEKFANAGNIKAAVLFGEVFAQKAKEKGVSKIVFDRAGYVYQGRVRAFAEALRKGGLEF